MEIDPDDFLFGKYVFENVVCHGSHCSVGNILWVKTSLKQPTITISKCPEYFCILKYGYLTFPNVSNTVAVSSSDIVRLVENANTSLTERGNLAALCFSCCLRASPPACSLGSCVWEHGQERLAIFLQAETQIANHNLKFDEENQECPVEVEGPE